MPEFQLNTAHRGAHPFYALSDFAKGYVEAMFFTNGDTGDDDENRLNELGVEALTYEAVKRIARDCAAFQTDPAVAPLLECAYQAVCPKYGPYDETRAGHDFWFSRQGHGAGYFDRDFIGKQVRDGLQEAARKAGEVYIEVYRNRIHYR